MSITGFFHIKDRPRDFFGRRAQPIGEKRGFLAEKRGSFLGEKRGSFLAEKRGAFLAEKRRGLFIINLYIIFPIILVL
jgi:hypothetical protein